MGCVSSSEHEPRSSHFRPRSKPCKSGYMLYSDGYTKWKKVFVILFQDSAIAWYRKPREKNPICHVILKNVCNLLAVGPVCKRIPSCPQKIPKKTSYSYMIAFPQWVSPGATGQNLSSPVCFFLCPNGDSMGTWMTSIAETLPPPPAPDGAALPNGAPYPPPSAPPAYNQQMPNGYTQPMHQQPGQQVIVQRERRSSGDFTKGFLAGAAIGYGFGGPWGWGWGWGWGYHPFYGWGYGDYDMDVDVDVDVHVDSSADIDNDLGSVGDFGGDDFQDFGDTADAGDAGDFGVADYGGGDYGGGDYGGGDYGGGDYGGGGDFGGGGGDGGGGAACGGCGGGGCGGGCGG